MKRNVILTCDQKPTRVRLIYSTSLSCTISNFSYFSYLPHLYLVPVESDLIGIWPIYRKRKQG